VERVRNLLTHELEEGLVGQPPGRDFAEFSLTEPFGAVATGMSIYEIAPGNASWPYHFEVAEEEWLIVIDGALTLRTPEAETVLRAGDVAAFPAGAAGAHAVRNHTEAPVRFAMPSTNAPYGGATIYPDSGKFGIGARGFHHRGRLGQPVDYWEGES
jgi:uncharacterized cupin superfamily protein